MRRTLAGSVITRLSVAVLCCSAAAVAEEPKAATLSYERAKGAEPCPSEREFRDEVAGRLGYDPFSSTAPKQISIVFGPGRRGHSATMTLKEGETRGSRTMDSEASDCRELASSAALAVALVIDPARMQPVARTAEPVASPAPHVVPADPPKPPPPDRPAASSVPVRWVLSAGGGVAVGIVPTAAPFASVSVGLRWPHASVGAEGRAFFSGTSETTVGTVSASLATGAIVGCGITGLFEHVDGEVCVMVAVGGLFGEASNVSRSEPKSTLYSHAGVRLGLGWNIGSLTLVPSVELSAPLTKTYLRIDDRGTQTDVWTTPTLGFSGGIALRLRL